MTNHVAALAASALLLAMPVGAQTGFFIGAHATGASLAKLSREAPDDPLDFGTGLGAHAGLSFGDAFGMLVNCDRSISGTKSSDIGFGQWDVLGRGALFQSGAAITYATAGFSLRAPSPSRANASVSVSPTAGVTWQVLLPSRIALEAGVLVSLGSYEDNHGEQSALITRLTLGASIYLVGKR